ncbi:MAG: glycosyltransferase [Pseudomonadota bacterium]
MKIVENSDFFDAEWYENTYPDARGWPAGAADHYLQFGAKLGRDPGPVFSTRNYLARYPEIAEAGHNPLWHYALWGAAENREPGAPARPLQDAITASRLDLAVRLDGPDATSNQETARTRLKDVLARTQDTRPHRFLTEFDLGAVKAVRDDLAALRDEAVAARSVRASVIMPTFNRANVLPLAVASVLSQSHQDLELIVVDDGSTDSTASTLARVADPRLKVIEGPHQGVSAARNRGMDAATGDVVFYLDSDNSWTPDFIRAALMSRALSGRACGYAGTVVTRSDGEVAGYRGEPFDWDACLDGNYVDLNVFFHDKGLSDRLGGFDPGLRRMVDWDLILRFTREERPAFLPLVACIYSADGDDPLRVSNTEPYLYAALVKAKHGQPAATAQEAAQGLVFPLAIKAGSDAKGVASIAQAFRDLGHEARIDGQPAWYGRHPDFDPVVIVMPDAVGFDAAPQQIVFRPSHRQFREPDFAAQVTEAVRSGLLSGSYTLA